MSVVDPRSMQSCMERGSPGPPQGQDAETLSRATRETQLTARKNRVHTSFALKDQARRQRGRAGGEMRVTGKLVASSKAGAVTCE